MVRRRGAPRRSMPRRRTYRVKIKWDPHAIPVRFKLLLPFMVEELDWEIQILLELERRVYEILEALGISKEEQEYYMAFTKRLWERALSFGWETFTLEKTSLMNEFNLRGLDATVLGYCQAEAEAMALLKGYKPIPPAWTYDNLIGAIYLADPGGTGGGYYDNRF